VKNSKDRDHSGCSSQDLYVLFPHFADPKQGVLALIDTNSAMFVGTFSATID
jgi:hypothetical protein